MKLVVQEKRKKEKKRKWFWLLQKNQFMKKISWVLKDN